MSIPLVPKKTRILIAHHDYDVLQSLVRAVKDIDYEIAGQVESIPEVVAEFAENKPDVVMTSLELSGGDVIQTLIDLSKDDPVPAIVITDKESLQDVERALQDHVMAYLLEPIDEDQIQPTIYLVIRRFEQFEALQEENQDLKQTLADRKVIEKAKGILMATSDLDEDAAFKRLQKMASQKRTKLIDIANAIILAQEAAAE